MGLGDLKGTFHYHKDHNGILVRGRQHEESACLKGVTGNSAYLNFLLLSLGWTLELEP
jgi:hypothetical protein